MRLVLAVLALACGHPAPQQATGEGGLPPTPEPRAGAEAVPLLHPPFDGWYTASNPFDHGVDPSRPPVGPILDYQGRFVAGSRDHRAWDFELPIGTPVLAAADGVVVQAGPMRPFHCAMLGREVTDQLAVVVEHAAPDGSVYATALHHLGAVAVEAGQTVRRGQPLGTSGSSGCSSGPHLHLVVERVEGEHRVPIDPFGWEGDLPDPWGQAARGAPSRWLWAQAPPLVFEDQHAPAADEGRAVVIAAVRYRGWNDDAHPSNESVRLRLDPRFAPPEGASLDGWALRFPDGTTWAFPDGLRLAGDVPLDVAVGPGPAPSMQRSAPLLPDGGGEVALLDATGRVADTFAYGLAVHEGATQQAAPERVACTSPDHGCVVLPLPGAVQDLAWGPDGALAMVVGTPGLPLVLSGAVTRVVDHVGGGRGGPAGALRPRWLRAGLLVFDAPRADGVRAVWYASPGLPAAEAIPAPVTGEARTVGDARDGLLVVASRPTGAPELVAWRPERSEPEVVTSHALPEEGVRIAPDGTHLAFLRAGRPHVLDLAHRAEVAVLGLGRDPSLAWAGPTLVALDGDRLVRVEGAEASPVRSGLLPGLLDADGGLVVVVDGREALMLTPDGRERARVVVGPLAPVEVALRVVDGRAELAWTVPVTPEAPPALMRAAVELAP